MELVNVLESEVLMSATLVHTGSLGGTILFKSRLLVPVLTPQVPLIMEIVIP